MPVNSTQRKQSELAWWTYTGFQSIQLPIISCSQPDRDPPSPRSTSTTSIHPMSAEAQPPPQSTLPDGTIPFNPYRGVFVPETLIVALHRHTGKVHAEAIFMTDPAQRHISPSYDGDGEDETRKAVESLAAMVGLKPEKDLPQAD